MTPEVTSFVAGIHYTVCVNVVSALLTSYKTSGHAGKSKSQNWLQNLYLV